MWLYHRLPEIYEEVQRGVESARESLSHLPKEPSKDPITDITTILHAFAMDVGRAVRGVPKRDGLHQTVRPSQDRFRKAIRQTAPDFRPYERRHRGKRTFSKPTFLNNEDGDDEESDDNDGGSDSDSQSDDGSSSSSSSNIPETARTIYIDEVMKRAKKLVTFDK